LAEDNLSNLCESCGRDGVWSMWERRFKDATIYFVAVAGIINEMFWLEEARPVVLLFLGGILGLPMAFNADIERVKKNGKS
jgi:hypothetical protein